MKKNHYDTIIFNNKIYKYKMIDRYNFSNFFKKLQKCEILFIDTEFTFDTLCFIQIYSQYNSNIGTHNVLGIINTSFEDLDYSLFLEILISKKLKVFHNALTDVTKISQHFDIKIPQDTIIDTEVISKLLNNKNHSLAFLSEYYLGITMNKSYQRINWRNVMKGYLHKGYRDYMILDVLTLHDVYHILLFEASEKKIEFELIKCVSQYGFDKELSKTNKFEDGLRLVKKFIIEKLKENGLEEKIISVLIRNAHYKKIFNDESFDSIPKIIFENYFKEMEDEVIKKIIDYKTEEKEKNINLE
jgi:DNA polymerase III epsilon subunit-like protein